MCDKICGDESDRSLGVISGEQNSELMEQGFVSRNDSKLVEEIDYIKLDDQVKVVK